MNTFNVNKSRWEVALVLFLRRYLEYEKSHVWDPVETIVSCLTEAVKVISSQNEVAFLPSSEELVSLLP